MKLSRTHEECEDRRVAFGKGTELLVTYEDRHVRLEVRPSAGDELVPLGPNQVVAEIAIPDLPEPVILSAERFGISLFYKELDFTKIRLVELLQQLRDEKRRSPDMTFLIVDQIASRYAMPVK